MTAQVRDMQDDPEQGSGTWRQVGLRRVRRVGRGSASRVKSRAATAKVCGLAFFVGQR
jgi:hypothetical protein